MTVCWLYVNKYSLIKQIDMQRHCFNLVAIGSGPSWASSVQADFRPRFRPRRTPAGHRYHTDEVVDRYFGVERQSSPRQTVFYCRVSRRARQADLRSQQQAMETFCLGAGEWLAKVGSGLDFKRPEHRVLMERIEGRGIGLLPVAHEDRLCGGLGLTGSSTLPIPADAKPGWSTVPACRHRPSWSST